MASSLDRALPLAGVVGTGPVAPRPALRFCVGGAGTRVPSGGSPCLGFSPEVGLPADMDACCWSPASLLRLPL